MTALSQQQRHTLPWPSQTPGCRSEGEGRSTSGTQHSLQERGCPWGHLSVIRRDLQQIVSPSLWSREIFASSPPKASLANLLLITSFAALPNTPAQIFAHCQGKICCETQQDRCSSLVPVCLCMEASLQTPEEQGLE